MKGKPGIYCMTPEKLERFNEWYQKWRVRPRGQTHTQKEIARILGISHQRVQQLCEARRFNGSNDRPVRMRADRDPGTQAHETVPRA